MPFTVMLALVLIGLGATLTGVAGVSLPERHRLAAAAALVAGAGAGAVVLAIGLFAVSSRGSGPAQDVFLGASAVGFMVTLIGLGWVRRRAMRDG